MCISYNTQRAVVGSNLHDIPEQIVHVRRRRPRRCVRRRRRRPRAPTPRPGEGTSREYPSRQRRGLVAGPVALLVFLLLLLLLLSACWLNPRRLRRCRRRRVRSSRRGRARRDRGANEARHLGSVLLAGRKRGRRGRKQYNYNGQDKPDFLHHNSL